MKSGDSELIRFNIDESQIGRVLETTQGPSLVVFAGARACDEHFFIDMGAQGLWPINYIAGFITYIDHIMKVRLEKSAQTSEVIALTEVQYTPQQVLEVLNQSYNYKSSVDAWKEELTNLINSRK